MAGSWSGLRRTPPASGDPRPRSGGAGPGSGVGLAPLSGPSRSVTLGSVTDAGRLRMPGYAALQLLLCLPALALALLALVGGALAVIVVGTGILSPGTTERLEQRVEVRTETRAESRDHSAA